VNSGLGIERCIQARAKWDWEIIVAHIEEPRPESWRDRLWLLMTAAGVVLLVCAALAI
jgi:hypothetical protein